MPKLKLHLLGGLRARLENASEPVTFPRRKGAALLAVLASPCGRSRSREELADLFWSRTGEEGARRNLRQALHVLRRTLPELSGLKITSNSVSLDPDQVECDVAMFEIGARDRSLAGLEASSKLYAGDFLHGFSLQEQAFEDWRSREAARLKDIALTVNERLIDRYAASARYPDAVAVANRTLSIDPLHEAAHRALIRIHEAAGRHGLARQQEEECRRVFSREYSRAAGTARMSGQDRADRPSLAEPVHTIPFVAFRTAPVVAVLPVDGGEDTPRDLAAVLTAKLIADVAAALPLTVVDHRTVVAVSEGTAGTRDIARDLGARYAVVTSLRPLGGCWRVDVSLIDVGTGRHLSSATLRRSGSDLSFLADRFSGQIAAGIAAKIKSCERRRALLSDAGALAGWEVFQRGMSLLSRRSFEALEDARSVFEQAVALEPGNARVVAGLAECVLEKGVCLVGVSREEAYPESLEIVRRAYELAPDDWFVNWVLGKAYQRNERFEAAGEAYLRAQRLQPCNEDIRCDYGNLLSFMGRTDGGLRVLFRALRSTRRATPVIARTFLQMRQYDMARRWAARELELAPKNSWAHIMMALALAHDGRTEEALARLQICERAHPGRIAGEFAVRPTQYVDPREQDHVLQGIELAGWQP